MGAFPKTPKDLPLLLSLLCSPGACYKRMLDTRQVCRTGTVTLNPVSIEITAFTLIVSHFYPTQKCD